MNSFATTSGAGDAPRHRIKRVGTTAHPALPAVEAQAPHGSRARRGTTRAIEFWHLLSLDAPTVAMLWTWFLARTNHVPVPADAVLAMGIAVWMLYAADRLLDSRALSPARADTLTGHELEPRHYFHHTHQRSFRCGIAVAAIALALLLPHLAPQSIRLYLVLGMLLIGYFILIHVNVPRTGAKFHRLPKELAVGVFFSAATFVPTVSREPSLRPALLPGAILFAVLCSLNCLFIYAWEHPVLARQNRAATHPATSISLRFLPRLAVIAAVSSFALALTDHPLPWPIPSACGLAAALLLLLQRYRHKFTPTTLRAAADICLLTPVLFLFY